MIGWTYESNEEAIAQAKENLDELDTQKKQDDIQAQIDYHEQLKTIMENLESEKEAAENQKMLTEWFKESGYSDANGMVAAIVDGFGKQLLNTNLFNAALGTNQQTDVSDVIEKGKKDWDEAKGKVNKALGDFEEKKNTLDELQPTSEGYNEAVNQYNTSLDALNTALDAAKKFAEYREDNFSDAIKSAKSEKKQLNISNKIASIDDIKGLGSINLMSSEWFTLKLNGEEYKLEADTSIEEFNNEEIEKIVGKAKKGDVIYLPETDMSYIGAKVSGKGVQWVPIRRDTRKGGNFYGAVGLSAVATGEESFAGGPALINELGTEAIITPSGTVTALPSKTGVVPADITKNLWSLGEIAPTLVAQLSSLNQKPVTANAGNTTYEEGQYFDHFTMNVYPAKGDDLTEILKQARANVALTRHNN